ncbi:MAG: TetR/AcrR family transcriptional regulator [Chloroflexota bacterium]
MNEEDLRVQRTRGFLRDAFIQLVIAHGYEPLTVRQIAKEAQVGYKTFYRHYESKEALLHAILAELVQGVRQTIDHTTTPQTTLQNTVRALEFTRANGDLFLALAQSPVADRLLEPLLQAMLEEGRAFLTDMDVPDELAIYHFAASFDALIKWWLKQGMPYSVEEMAAYIQRLVVEPMALLRRAG